MEVKGNDVGNVELEEPGCCADHVSREPRNGLVSRKRKISEEACSSKRQKFAGYDENGLVLLPDDVLLIILSYLDSHSLIRLKDTCSLFARLCQDYTLWRRVNFESVPATLEDVKTIGKLIHSETKYIRILGKYKDVDAWEDTITQDWLEKVKDSCPNLEVLALPHNFINCQSIWMSNFPPTLTSLDLSNTRLRNLPVGRSYFRDISNLIPNLKSLILSNCDWFEPHSLMAISKCKYLEELRLNDCIQVKDCLAYCGLSTRGGFRALKTLDLRRCMVTTSELVCFSSVPTLTNLFLENVHVGGQFSVIFIDPAIIVLCTRNEMQVPGGARALAPRPHLLIESLTVRHFQTLTDITLAKLARDANSLKFLDVTGTGVTREGIETFRSLRPYVTLIHNAFCLEE